MISEDFEYIFNNTIDIWDSFRNKNIFITGGTGFFGTWIVESLIYANNKLKLNMHISLLIRNKHKHNTRIPYWTQHEFISYLIGDVRDFEFSGKKYDFVLHAATDVSLTHSKENTIYNFDVIVNGTKHVLDFSKIVGATNVLIISSGAIYGKQPASLKNIAEDYDGAPNIQDIGLTYGEGKRAAELLGLLYSNSYNFNVKIARGFTFVGPYMKLDGDLAIGNFIKNYISNEDIIITGDGSPFRSYLYASELVICLLFILIKGKNCVPYNVGSDKAISIKELAELIAKINNKNLNVDIREKTMENKLPSRYVPSVSRINKEFGLKQKICLDQMIAKTIKWATEKN